MTALIDLDSSPMDPEFTQAADTLGGETQSIHAWSQADDATEPAAYMPTRSWRLPVAAAAITSAAVIAAAVMLWPHEQHSLTEAHPTPAPPVAPTMPTLNMPTSPPALPESPDQRFLALLKQWGVQVVAPSMAINAAHSVCKAVTENVSQAEITQRMVNQTPGADLKTAGIFLDAAQEVYCPPGT